MYNDIPEYCDVILPNFDYVFKKYMVKKDNLVMLQIGGYTGKLSSWILNNINDTCTLIDIDTWQGSPEEEGNIDNYQQDFNSVEKLYDFRMKGFKNVKKFKGTSDSYFESIKDKREIFDFIYVDGSHKHDDVYSDAINSYKHLKVGGVIAFDDYFWNIDKPKEFIPHYAIKKFVEEHSLEIIIDENSNHSNWKQLWAIKI
jgi:hypothetical protein